MCTIFFNLLLSHIGEKNKIYEKNPLIKPRFKKCIFRLSGYNMFTFPPLSKFSCIFFGI
ncbi:hypothetical protein Hanom_Chr15g01375991 [Helianthus anomalus]